MVGFNRIRRSASGARASLWLTGLGVLGGCFGDPHVECVADTECREAFGFGNVCQDDGYCGQVDMLNRCTSSFPADLLTNPAAHKDDVILASVHDHNYDVAELQSVRLAVIEADEAGGIDGTNVSILECTYGIDPQYDELDENGAAGVLGEFLTGRLGIPGYIGPYTSGQTQALYTAVSEAQAFIISPSATSPGLTYIDGSVKSDADPGILWRTAPPDSLQGRVAADDMWARGLRNVAVVYQSGPYGDGLSQIFVERFTQLGGEVTGLTFDNQTQLFAHVATLANNDDIEEVFMISGETNDISAFLNAAGGNGFDADPDADPEIPGINVFLSDAAKDTDMLEGCNADGRLLFDQIRGTAPKAPDPSDVNYTTFKISYEAKYAQDPEATIYMPYSYDASWLAMYSAAWSLQSQDGALTGKGMGAGMRNVSEGRAINLLPTDWNTGRASFSEGTAINVRGTSGELDYDPATEETSAPVDVWAVNEDGNGFDVVDTLYPD